MEKVYFKYVNKNGDTILYIENENGEAYLMNMTLETFHACSNMYSMLDILTEVDFKEDKLHIIKEMVDYLDEYIKDNAHELGGELVYNLLTNRVVEPWKEMNSNEWD